MHYTVAEWAARLIHLQCDGLPGPRGFIWPLLEQRRGAAEDPVDQSVAGNISVVSTACEPERGRGREIGNEAPLVLTAVSLIPPFSSTQWSGSCGIGVWFCFCYSSEDNVEGEHRQKKRDFKVRTLKKRLCGGGSLTVHGRCSFALFQRSLSFQCMPFTVRGEDSD